MFYFRIVGDSLTAGSATDTGQVLSELWDKET